MPNYTHFEIGGTYIKLSIAANFGLSTFFKINSEYNDMAYIFDAFAYEDKVEEIRQGRYWKRYRNGTGVRILVKFNRWKGMSGFNLGMIAAATTLNKTSAKYKIEGYGLGADGLFTVLGGLSDEGPLDMNSFDKIIELTHENIANYIDSNVGNLKSERIPTIVNIKLDDDYQLIKSLVSGIKYIEKRYSFKKALEKAANDKVLPYLVWFAYNSIFPDRKNEEAIPSNDDRLEAINWLNLS